MAKIQDLKSTLNLPRTDFPMKAKLPEREPIQLADWERMGLYRRILEVRAGAPLFVLHDGPPYPTGDIHLGTGLNKILKDMVVKSRSMAGFRAPYVPGWDCHGLPIENMVEKQLGGRKDSVSPAEFRRLCREYATRYVDQNRRDFKRLGIFGQWDDPYLTMSPQYEAKVAETFLDFLERGYAYRGLKPVYWCFHDKTALAEAEVEYEDHTSPSIWVRYPVVQHPPEMGGQNRKGFYAIVWTTTPWTLPASMALAFHPAYNYILAEDDKGDVYIVAEKLSGSVTAATGLRLVRTISSFPGKLFTKTQFKHPFLDRTIPGVLADYVTFEQGSGIVHTAPGHGVEDFYTGQEYGLETYAPLDDRGVFTEGLEQYKGKSVFEANPAIIALLRERGALLAESKIQHSYPHCWRCHNPVIFRATEQWFLHMDQGSETVPKPKAQPLRQLALGEIKLVKWIPSWGEQRLASMVAGRPDWCISRQRFWGVPIIAFDCEPCGKRLEDVRALRNVVKWFEREGADAWYTHPAEELLPPGTKCAKCGAARWRKGSDILDVWFESGSSHLAVLRDQEWPASVYLEGPDQYRGWFQSSLLVAVGERERAPYRCVVTHGWTLDEQGRPMSKSLGNVVLPKDICEKWGADLLRLWVVSQDYTAEVYMSDDVMTQLSESYRKLRNTFRFALMNLDGFEPARDSVPDSELWEMDTWMLHRTGEHVRQCRAWYENFEFHRVFHALHDFAVVELSAFYFDVLKDRLYTFAPRNPGRRSAQTAVYRISSSLIRLLAPLTAFTSEEAWKHLPHRPGEPEGVHLALFPAAEDFPIGIDAETANRWNLLREVRGVVLNALERSRQSKLIAGSLEAKVVLHVDGDYPELSKLVREYKKRLPELFIVSQVEFTNRPSPDGFRSDAMKGVAVEIVRADGRKCERCWNYSTRVGANHDYPTVCERCVAALEEIERTGVGSGHGLGS